MAGIPPAGQIVGTWLAVERIAGTRQWLMRCTKCATESHVSSIALGKALTGGAALPDCAGCAPCSRCQEPDGVCICAQTFPAPDPVVVEASPEIDESDAVFGRADRMEQPQAVLDVIREAMHGTKRNKQTRPGPSQIGGCERRLGYHLATGEGNGAPSDDAWRPTVGTAAHTWLAEAFGSADSARWIPDHRVSTPIAGTIDLYDADRHCVIDFKVTGQSTRDKAKRGVVSDKYETQLDLYGLGMMADGHPVETVALLFLPASGPLGDAVWYERPINIDRAIAGVEKLRRIEAMLAAAPVEKVLPLLPIVEDYCGGCPARGKVCDGPPVDHGRCPEWPIWDQILLSLSGAA